MAKDKQYREDSARLAVLIQKYTNIPQDKVYQFVMENTADNLLSYANKLCKTDMQRQKLTALFEFKALYETVKGADKNRVYQFADTDVSKEYFKNYFADNDGKEYFAVAYLDTQNQVIKTEKTAGTLSQANVYPREIFKEALFINAGSVVLAHTHPSGDLTPSTQDIEVTARVKQGMEVMGGKLLDHIIVGDGNAVSLLDMGEIHNIRTGASTLRENTKTGRQAAKMPGIKQQLALAKQQLDRESRTTAPQRKTNERGDR